MAKATTHKRTIGALLKDPYLRIQKRSYAQLAEQGHPGITPAHSAVFRNIQAEGSRISDLAADAGITKQSMGYLVESLAGMGYVELSRDPRDGRAKLVCLTASGKEVVARLKKMSRSLERRISGQMGADWLAELREKLAVLDGLLAQG